MENNEKQLKSLKEQNISLDKNKEFLKKALLAYRPEKEKGKAGLMLSFIFMAAVAATAVIMNVDDNQTDSKTNNLGGIWCTYNDKNDGGNSYVWPPAPEPASCENLFIKSSPGFGNKGYAVRITATAGTKLGYDFVGVQTFLGEYATCPRCSGIDIRRFKGVKFKIKGKMPWGKITFSIPHEGSAPDKSGKKCETLTSYADYEANISKYISSDWTEVKLNFRKDFKQPHWAKDADRVDIEAVLADANMLKWQWTEGKGTELDLWIDDLELY